MTHRARFDHLVIGAADLDHGRRWFRELTGQDIPIGGAHPRMATHNCLAQLGDDAFLEIISTDATATPVDRSRWFSLDAPEIRRQLTRSPRLLTWALGVADLHQAIRISRDHGFDPGDPVEMTRGELVWQLSVRDDGDRPDRGVYPTLIEWPGGVSPACSMSDLGLKLASMTLAHPDISRLKRSLEALGATLDADFETASLPRLSAVVESSDRTIEL